MAGPEKKANNQAHTTAAAGEKHQTEKESPAPKKAKTEKQPTLEETLGKADDEEDHDVRESKSTPSGSKGDSAVKPEAEPDVPSSVLEKGIIYFFIRGRVGIEEPSGVNDIARSHMLLRPMAKDAKLGEGPIGDAGNSRLFALPKKVFPVSGKDRYMFYVEKSADSFQTIKDEFLSGSDYTTKTVGTRHTPAATPAGEGVYAITTTGRESHLAYIITLPEELGEVQSELGLKQRGSFILSTKNPNQEGPANAQFSEKPDFPKDVMDEFGSLRWLPSKPVHFDYVNTQMLLIGESSGLEKATEKQKADKDQGKEDPKEALEHLEEEDLNRMRHLPGGDSASIYTDLEAQAKDYPKLQTTF